jgi:hypothetical protein
MLRMVSFARIKQKIWGMVGKDDEHLNNKVVVNLGIGEFVFLEERLNNLLDLRHIILPRRRIHIMSRVVTMLRAESLHGTEEEVPVMSILLGILKAILNLGQVRGRVLGVVLRIDASVTKDAKDGCVLGERHDLIVRDGGSVLTDLLEQTMSVGAESSNVRLSLALVNVLEGNIGLGLGSHIRDGAVDGKLAVTLVVDEHLEGRGKNPEVGGGGSDVGWVCLGIRNDVLNLAGNLQRE